MTKCCYCRKKFKYLAFIAVVVLCLLQASPFRSIFADVIENSHADWIWLQGVGLLSSDESSISSKNGNGQDKSFQPEFHFRTYGNKQYEKAKARIVQEANQAGWFQTVEAWGPEDLPIAFQQNYSEILKLPRGGGYWIWKYPLLQETLNKIRTGDFVIYLDAGCQVNPKGEVRFYQYAKDIQESPFDMLCFDNKARENRYTTEQAFQAFGISTNNTEIRNTGQYLGGVLMIEKGAHSHNWLNHVQQILEIDPWVITDKYNNQTKTLNPAFKDHRHDQSISSISRKLGGCVRYYSAKECTRRAGRARLADKPFWAMRLRDK